MFQPTILFIALRYGKTKNKFGRFVTWLSALGLMLGVLALIIILSVMNGFEREMSNGLLNFIPQVQVTTTSGHFDPKQLPADSIKPYFLGVKKMTSLVSNDVVIQSHEGISSVKMLGITHQEYEPILYSMDHSIKPQLKPQHFNIILGWQLAKQLNVSIGDSVRLIVPSVSVFTPMGRMPSQRLFKVSDIYYLNSDIEDNFVLINQEDAAKILKLPNGNITSWRLYLNDPLSIDAILSKPLPSNLHIYDWRLIKGDLFNAVKMEKHMMTLLISLIIIVAAFNIVASLSMLVMEKQGEIAILQTLGFTQKKVLMIFLLKGMSTGFVGATIGSILGIIIATNLNSILDFFHLSIMGITLPTSLDYMQIIFIYVFSILISLLATLYPAWNASRQHPAEVLRYE